MGLAELMIRLGIRYGSDESVAFIDKLYGFLAQTVYDTSVEIAQEKGAFPKFEAEKFVPERVYAVDAGGYSREGARTRHPQCHAADAGPTGTTGTMVNTSTGIEPFLLVGVLSQEPPGAARGAGAAGAGMV